MTWHLFALVWGEPFVRRFAELAVPFQAMAGNVPALAGDGPVVYHAYSDEDSRDHVRAALAPLARWCDIEVHRFDDASARGLLGPDYRYEVQRTCLRDLSARASDGDSIVLLDSNFVVGDGTLRAVAERRRQGFRAASVSVLRVETGAFAAALGRPSAGEPIGPRRLLAAGLAAMHPMTDAFFVDARPFTPYPSQISWRVGAGGIVNRNFLPHPLMVPASLALARAQSTMDYELALRAVADDAHIHVCGDSDEMLVVKFSSAGHGGEPNFDARATPEYVGQFLLACTNRRHRRFVDTPVVFHTADVDARYAQAIRESQALVDAAYAWIDRAANEGVALDPRRLIYLKSHFGPIEDFMSPQLEPAALARLA